ncbi:MAG: radical SAM protein [Bacillaceae bacterium]
MPNRPYTFLEYTAAICSKCFRKAEAKIIEQDGNVYLWKRCHTHGMEKVLISTDYEYYKLMREFIKPSEMPYEWNTPIQFGCPYDCGLCPDHEQHSCLTVVEITDACNLTCPICYAESGEQKQHYRSFEVVKGMLDRVVANERNPDVIQISGGEPTIHPQFFQILDYCKTLPIKHLMVNTNGLKIANDPTFAKKLASYMPSFEIYLQFDSLHGYVHEELRGRDLTDVRLRAIERLNEYNISTTLVVTLKKGLNDDHIGEILDFAVKQRCIRGVTFQPIQVAGRFEEYDPAKHRLTLSEVRQQIIKQSNLFTGEDVIPVPCHPESLAMGYGLKLGGEFIPLTSMLDKKILLEGDRNTIVFESDEALREKVFSLFSLNVSPSASANKLSDLLCCLPKFSLPENIGYENVFRVLIMKFLDAYDLDMRNVKKSCVHIAHPDGKRIIPFDTYNLFYREGKEKLLEEIRNERRTEMMR